MKRHNDSLLRRSVCLLPLRGRRRVMAEKSIRPQHTRMEVVVEAVSLLGREPCALCGRPYPNRRQISAQPIPTLLGVSLHAYPYMEVHDHTLA